MNVDQNFFKGTTFEVNIKPLGEPKTKVCPDCDGWCTSTVESTCRKCGGKGWVLRDDN